MLPVPFAVREMPAFDPEVREIDPNPPGARKIPPPLEAVVNEVEDKGALPKIPVLRTAFR
jgi:hypothetical protein